MLTTRILERAEWTTVLKDTDIGTLGQMLPDETRVIVIEDEGVVVGCWALAHLWQAEGIWIAPAARQSGSVMRRLIRAMYQQATDVGAKVLLTGADTDDVRALLAKSGAEDLKINLYAWPLATE